MPVPFVIYADCKAITEKVQGCKPKDNKSFTESYQKHTDCGYGYKVVFTTKSIVNQFHYIEVKMLFISYKNKQ